ncbi:hypothetical protein AC579_2857 [Pseudocercospora musae]|uniref:NADH:flavin oxidoreductase/NADH oxidase N-terminal domain-containing protein n=1 Tax=Pseudocercospora musae TaxID=113226 RepID=A0A139I3J3_9PEZI|nr:hypothetical protein AC579_2857 [Pseudocercospora musae]
MASNKSNPKAYNAPVPGIPYFSPTHQTSPGTPFSPKSSDPTLFKPLQIRGCTLKNRILVAPMCQYSTAESGPQIGALTPYHIATLGHYALKGASLVFIEASGVQRNGRISPNCPGIWSDAQIDGIKAVADIIHAQGALCGLQLAHAGRKASTLPPFVAARSQRPSARAHQDAGGWGSEVVGPSGGEDMTWDGKPSDDAEGGYFAPRELKIAEIQDLIQDFAAAANRGVRAGVDVIEIHAAHGYLLHEFLSPITNRRTDEYGGSFENRTRCLLQVIRAMRRVMPSNMPLFLRLSSTEWMEASDLGKKFGSWDVESSIALSKIVSDLGVDLLDVSSGGNHPQQRINMFNSKDYQTRIAARIRREVRAAGKELLIGAVGLITEAEQAREIVEEGNRIEQEAEVAKEMTEGKEPMADVILVARQFMREPEWVLKVAWRLGVDIAWPSQFLRVKFPKL